MKKLILAVALTALSTSALACGSRCGDFKANNVTSGHVQASAVIPYNAQGTAIGTASLLAGSYSNTDGLTYTGYKGLHAEASGSTLSWFDGQANAFVTGGRGPSASASFDGSTEVDASRCVDDSTIFRGDHLFDYEAVSARVDLGSSIIGAGEARAANVYGGYTSERAVRVVGDAEVEADAYGRTIGNRETKTNVVLSTYTKGTVTEGAWGVNGPGEYAAGQVEVNGYADGEGKARD